MSAGRHFVPETERPAHRGTGEVRHPLAHVLGGEVAHPAGHDGELGQGRPGVQAGLAGLIGVVVAQMEADGPGRLA